MNNYSKKSSQPKYNQQQQQVNVESHTQSFISSISTSINSNEQKTFLSKSQSLSYKKNRNCSCCDLKQVSFHTTSSSNTSLLSVTSAPLTSCTYMTFDVKMASTPILNKRKNFYFDDIDNVNLNLKKKQMSTPLTESVKRRFSSTKQYKIDAQLDKLNCLPKSANHHCKTTSVSLFKRPKYSLSKKRGKDGLVKVFSSEMFDSDGYLAANFIKKSSSSDREKKIQMKKRMQKMNNISTSTKKENTTVNVEKKISKKQHKCCYDFENVKKLDELKRKAKTHFVKRIKLESAAAVAALATHLPMQSVSENVFSFNSYFPNSCLNKFNQLGQLQVWFV
jgi:hypothetical protein